jgi:hypothetical protein
LIASASFQTSESASTNISAASAKSIIKTLLDLMVYPSSRSARTSAKSHDNLSDKVVVFTPSKAVHISSKTLSTNNTSPPRILSFIVANTHSFSKANKIHLFNHSLAAAIIT